MLLRRLVVPSLILSVALAAGACAPASTGSLDPALCKSVLDQGGSTADYGRCMLGQAKGKSVGGMPVLNKSAQIFLRDKSADACLVEGMSQTDYIACEFAQQSSAPPSQPVTEPAPLPLVIQSGN